MEYSDIIGGRIYLGDCVEVCKSLDDECVDLTVTSPPYDDLRDYKNYTGFDFEGLAKELFRITKTGGVIVWNVNDGTVKGSRTGTSFRQALFFKDIGFNLHDVMIWDKDVAKFPMSNRYGDAFEYVFILSKKRPKTFNGIKDIRNKHFGDKLKSTTRGKDGSLYVCHGTLKGKTIAEFGMRTNVWKQTSVQSNSERTGHPAQFPLHFVRDHIISWSNEGETVFDPFLGSGTTACAAVETGRKWIGSEIAKEYFDICVKRINKYRILGVK